MYYHYLKNKSRQNILDYLRRFDAGEFGIQALEFTGEGFVAYAELMQHRRVQIVNRRNILNDRVAQFVGRDIG